LLAVLFAVVYAAIVMVGTAMGVADFSFYLLLALGMMLVQYMIGPKIVEWSMHVRYVKREEQPRLYQMVESLAQRARMPMPRVGISPIPLPNAFAFGRSIRDGRVCVTEGIMRLLDDDELKAVLGHELSHIRNRDVLTMTLLSVIPMIMYRIAWHFMFYGGSRRRDDRGGSTALIGLAAFVFYLVTNLLVMYASRIREYFADRGSVDLGCKPAHLASSLYKLVYGSARTPRQAFGEVEGLKAFFLNDPSRAMSELKELAQVDMDKSGSIDSLELERLRTATVRLTVAEKAFELMSTHPNMLKRIKRLSEYK
jgi:heat shock protein HtpX